MPAAATELRKIWLIKICHERSNSPCLFYKFRSVGNKEKGQKQYAHERLLPIPCRQELLDHLQLRHNRRCHRCHQHSWCCPQFHCVYHRCWPQHNQGLEVLKAYVSIELLTVKKHLQCIYSNKHVPFSIPRLVKSTRAAASLSNR